MRGLVGWDFKDEAWIEASGVGDCDLLLDPDTQGWLKVGERHAVQARTQHPP